MISINFVTPQEMQVKIAELVKRKRLSLNLSQKTLSDKSGVSYGVLKKFEQTGQISLESLLKLAMALGALKEFDNLFQTEHQVVRSLDDLMQENVRKRGRK